MSGWDKGSRTLRDSIGSSIQCWLQAEVVNKEAILSLSKTSSARPGWLKICTKSHYSQCMSSTEHSFSPTIINLEVETYNLGPQSLGLT